MHGHHWYDGFFGHWHTMAIWSWPVLVLVVVLITFLVLKSTSRGSRKRGDGRRL